jgi:cyd operon protein YbgT
MWYFTWILGLLLACSLGIINVLRLEAQEAWDKEHIPVDPVTQLLTKDYMLTRLKEKVENSKRNGFPFSILTLNLSGFFKRNHFVDYEIETTLRNVVAYLKGELRSGIDIAAQMDNDTILIVMPGVPLKKAEFLANLYQTDISNAVKAPHDLTVEIAVGVAEYSGITELKNYQLTTADEVNTLINTATRNFFS